MRSFFRFFAERHTLAILFTLMIILLGLSTLTRIKRDLFPRVDFGELFVTTRYPGASPEDVELNVTNKIEEQLKEVSGIERMVSFSMENISTIDVVIDPDASDQEKVKDDIRDAVNRVTDFPVEVTEAPLITELKTSIFPVIEVGVSGDLPYRELREIARQLEKKLEDVEGVASIEKFGYLDREIKVEVNPGKVHQYQIPLQEIIGAIRGRNIRATAGSFESYTSEKNLVTLTQFKDPSEVKEVIVRTTFEGPLIKVRDLANVVDDFEEARILSRMNGKQAISFVISKKESADIIRTVDAVKRLVERERERLPEGVEILYSDDTSRLVRNRLGVVQWNGLIGLALVLIMLSIFLNLRAAFWVALGIPVAVLGTIFLMPVFDVYLDAIAMGGVIMVLGIIVDDAIIVAENIQRHKELGKLPLEAAVEGTREVFAPVLATILTTFLAFAPLLFMTGLMGKFVFVIPLAISLALFISLFEVVIALPAHLTMGEQRRGKTVRESAARVWFKPVRAGYSRIIHRLLKFRYPLIFFALLLLAGALWYAANFMTFVLMPSDSAEAFYILVELPTGTSLQATSDKVEEIEKLITELPEGELDSYVTRIGYHSWYSYGENENWAIVGVSLTPFAKRDRNADQIVEELRQKINRLEGYDRLTFIIEAGGPPVGRAVTIRVVGSDDGLRTSLADSVIAFLGTVAGVKDIDRDDKSGKEQVEIKVDHDRLARVGLTVADIAQNVRIAFDGEVVTSVRYGDEDVDFRVQLAEKARSAPRYLSSFLIPNREGRLIPLGEVAWFKIGPGPSNFYHYNGERALTVTADITKGTTTPLLATEAVLSHFNLDGDWPGMRFVVGGEAQETQESLASLVVAFITAVIAIYFLLILLFNSVTQPFLVLVAIPFGIVGVIGAFVLHGQPLGFIAMMGVIGLAGVVVNDSLVMVNHINDLRRQRPNDPVPRIVAEGASNRLRAVIMTTLTTVGALLPLAYGIGGSDPFLPPMALALGYGLIFATPLTLVLVPCLYLAGNDIGKLFRRKQR